MVVYCCTKLARLSFFGWFELELVSLFLGILSRFVSMCIYNGLGLGLLIR